MRPLATILVALTTLVACEFIVALFGVALPREQVRLVSEFYVPDLELGFRVKPNLSNYEVTWLNGELRQRYSTDRLGFRNVGRDYSTSHYFVIGDSFAFGDWVERQDTFYGRLEQRMGCPVITLGVSGYELVQYLVLLEKYVPRNGVKKRVLLFLFANDLKQAKSKAEMPRYYEREGFLLYDKHAPWSRRLSVYRTLSFRLYVGFRQSRQYVEGEADNGLVLFQYRGASPTYLKERQYVGIEEQLSDLVNKADLREDIGLSVFLLPSKESTYRKQYHALFGGNYLNNEEHGYQRIEQMLLHRHVEVHNMTTLFRSNSDRVLYLRADPHWNTSGHALMAEYLWDWMANGR